MNQLHQSLTPERYSPVEVSVALKNLYPDGFFDFASCSLANKVIGASAYYSREDDALESELPPASWKEDRPVEGYCNAPGGKVKNRSLQQLFWNRLHEAYLRGEIASLVFLNFNLNAGAALCPQMLRYPRVYTTNEATVDCVSTSGRIKFLASRSELLRIVDVEMQKATTQKKKDTLQKKIEAIHALPAAVPGTDLVQESAPTNPGQFIFLPPRDEGWKQDHQLRTFKKEFEIFGTWAPGRLYG